VRSDTATRGEENSFGGHIRNLPCVWYGYLSERFAQRFALRQRKRHTRQCAHTRGLAEVIHVQAKMKRCPSLGHLLLLCLVLASHGRVPSILHRIFRPSREQLGDLTPAVSQFPLCVDKGPVLQLAPATFLDVGIKVVEPSLSALLANPTWNFSSNFGPFGHTTINAVYDSVIFIFRPRSFYQPRSQNLHQIARNTGERRAGVGWSETSVDHGEERGGEEGRKKEGEGLLPTVETLHVTSLLVQKFL
jgi:hypothetical protein